MKPKSKKVGLYSGEFADLCGVSRDTILYYDKIDLFKPEIVGENGYRFYSLDQVHKFDLLLMMRSANLPLEKIKSYFESDEPLDMLSLLRKQSQSVANQISELQKLCQKLITTADAIDFAIHAQYDMPRIEKKERAFFVAFEVIPKEAADRQTRMAFVRNRLKYCHENGLPCDFLRSGIIKKENIEKNNFVKDYFCVRTSAYQDMDQMTVQPDGYYAVIEHKGSYKTLSSAYIKLKQYIKEQGRRIIGDAYEMEILGYSTALRSSDFIIQIAIQIDERPDV